jgi:hypothetical protein
MVAHTLGLQLRTVAADVCVWHKADMVIAPRNVRFWG